MNDFDKIFSDKLHNHKTPPPANGWEQLNAALDKEQRAKKKVIFWRVAAAILLLLVAGMSWWAGNQWKESPVAEKTSIESESPEVNENPDNGPARLALEEDKTSADRSEKQSTVGQKTEPEKSDVSSSNDQFDIAKKEKLKKPSLQPQSVLAVAETETTGVNEVQPIESIQVVEVLAVEPLRVTESKLLTVESVQAKVSPPVTIIYKPGAQSENNDKNGALEFLSELRNTNISFSEIRNAKAELLAKVFSKKENEGTP